MKKLLLTVVFITGSLCSFSQTAQVPNGDFEHWFSYEECPATDSLAGYITYDQLVHESSRRLICPASPAAVKSTDSYSGTYALELNPYFNGSEYYLSAVYSSLRYESQIPTGVPFTDTPSKLTGYVKFNQTGDDILTILAQILDNNGNYKGWGYFMQASSLTEYTKFQIPITYDPKYDGTATALIISFSVGEIPTSTGGFVKAHEGTKMIVDHLAFEYGATTATKLFAATSPINVFAANNNINFSETVSDIHVVDMVGTNKLQEPANTKALNAASLNRGLYVVTYNYNGSYFSKKVVIE